MQKTLLHCITLLGITLGLSGCGENVYSDFYPSVSFSKSKPAASSTHTNTSKQEAKKQTNETTA